MSDNTPSDSSARHGQQPQRAARIRQDVLALGIAVVATIMVAGVAGSALTQVMNKAAGIGVGPDRLLTNALLLNIALVIFGWRRYDDLRAEVVAHRRREAESRLLATRDGLTGCLTRHAIGKHTDALITAARAEGETVAFLMIDINNFKQINDMNGHAVGDAILSEMAKRLQAGVPEGSLVARLGGDEFACAIRYRGPSLDAIDQIAQGVIARFGAPVDNDVFAGTVSVAIGIAHSDRIARPGAGPADAAALLHMADLAVFQAKKLGANQVMWFEATMESELRYRCEMEAAIRAGIQAGEFVPYYEQQVDLASGEILGFEMLARWHSPVFGLVGPDTFIPIAEEIGVIADLSERLVVQALADAREWDPRLTLSVNISPLQLRDPWFAQKLLKLLVAANFPPSRLEIEITESALHHNVPAVQALITSLRNQGIAISLDDFGTGYSSLAQLRKLPFDRIKIDRSFVSAMPHDPDSRTIVESIATLGKGLGLPITAEGIENEELREHLLPLGHFKGQGYFYGQPLPADQTRNLLAMRSLLAAPNEDVALAADNPATDTCALPLSGNGQADRKSA